MQRGADPGDQEVFQTPPQRASPEKVAPLQAWPLREWAPPQRQDTFWEKMAEEKATPETTHNAQPRQEAARPAFKVETHDQSTPWAEPVYSDAVQAASPRTEPDGDTVAPRKRARHDAIAAPYPVSEMQRALRVNIDEQNTTGAYSVYSDAFQASPREMASDEDDAAYPVSEMQKPALTVRVEKGEERTPDTLGIYAHTDKAVWPKKMRCANESALDSISELQKIEDAQIIKLGMPATYSLHPKALLAPYLRVSEMQKTGKNNAAAETAVKEARIKEAVQDLVSYAVDVNESSNECEPREGMDIREAMGKCFFPTCWHRAGKTAIDRACTSVYPSNAAFCADARQPTWDVYAECLTIVGFWQGNSCIIPFPQIQDFHVAIYKYAKHLQQSCSKVSTKMPLGNKSAFIKN